MEAGFYPLRRSVRLSVYTAAILLFISSFSLQTFGQRNNLTFSCDFEGSTLLSVWPTVVGRTTQSSDYSREGSYSARVEVVKGDPMIAQGARSEMNLNPITTVPAEQWFGMSYYIPTSWTADASGLTDILAQWHSESGTPPVAFGINVNSWYVQFQSSGIVSLGTVNKGTWTDVVFHMKWSTGSDGLTEIWINGTKVGTYTGSNFPDTSPGPFFKCGDYKWPWNTGSGELDGAGSLTSDRLLYIDAVRVGNASATYADVAPGTSTTTSTPVISLNATQTITLPTNSISLTGTVTDLLSVISTTAWSQVSGPNNATIKTPSSLTTTASGLIAGNYVFKLTATDLLASIATATLTVTVNPAPTPPVVSAGTNQTITLPSNTINLKGSASDASGTITSYSWTQVSGPGTAKISSASSLTSAVSGLVAGTYVFSLSVTDSYGLSSSASVTVIVNVAANQPPVANAGANQTITLPANSVTLNGSSSNDPDGSIASYSWTKVSGPAQGAITNAGNATTTVTNLAAGTYTYQLLVTDNSGATNTDMVTITVNAAANQPPVANAGSSKTITLPTNTVTLDGSASSDPDGTIASYGWSQVSGPSTATLKNTTTSAPSVSGLVAGQYVFQLTVTDNSGATATAQVKVIVNPAPAAPVNQSPIANAGSNQTITLPVSSVTLDGTGSSDPDGTVAGYKWTQITGPGQATVAKATSATTLVSNLVQGTYTYQLVVTDNSGATDADTVTIKVNPAVNQRPVANAGSSKTITLPVNSAVLDGSASSDPDGTIVTYNWTQVSGPSTASISNNGTATPTAGSLQAGTYYFQLTVTDNGGLTNTAQVKVIVRAGVNLPPVANAGGAQSITLPVNTVTLNGSASQDDDGTIVAYNWIKVSGPVSAAISNSSNMTTAVNNLVQGVYIFQLTVTDNSGNTALDSVTITVNAAVNQSPNANAGNSQTITLPVSTVTLNASKSNDPDGTIVSYNWAQISGPANATVTGANTSTPAVSGLLAGTYYFQVTVTDNDGATDNAQVKVTVRAAANQPPVANAGAGQTITLPVNSVTLDGTGSVDPDGTIKTYAWTKISGPNQGSIANAGNATTSVTNLAQGTYLYKLTVTDNSGAISVDTVTITVNAAKNQAPVANAGNSKTITLPVNSVSFDGSGSFDPDGTIASYNWAQVSGPGTASIANGNTATPTVSGLVAGQYMFQLTVTDNSGATARAQVKVVVNPAVNQVPVANAGTDQTITLPVNSITLDGSKSFDPDGTISAFSWTKTSGSGAITLTNSNTAKPTVVGLLAGQYVFQLTVTDNSGATATDNVTITVNAASVAVNQAPVANAGTDQAITAPANTVTLDGSKSYDPDGSIVSYNWTKVSGTGGTIGSANTVKPSVSSLQPGSYTFKLTVTDNKGATASDQVIILVNAAIQAPVADAGNDTTIAIPATSVMLDGSASSDRGGSIASYEWTQVSGPATAAMNSWNTAKTMASNLVVGAYEFQLTVKNSQGTSATASVKVTVMETLRTSAVASMLLYPNPAQSIINLRVVSDSTGSMKVNIFDMTGKLVMTKEMTKSQSFFDQSLNIGALAHGMYTMQVTIGTNKSITSKFVK